MVFLVYLKRSRFIQSQSRSSVTFKCLNNAARLSRFTFYLGRKVDVACLSVELGVVNVASSTLKVVGIL